MLDEWVEQPHTPSWEIVHHDESYGGTEAPLFILEHRADFLSQGRGHAVAFAASNDTLFLATSRNFLLRHDASGGPAAELELSKNPEARVRRLFVDPLGLHALVSLQTGSLLETYYIDSQWKSARPLPKLKNITITSLGWRPVFHAHVPNEILLGSDQGVMYSLSLQGSRKEKVKQLFTLPGGHAPIAGLAQLHLRQSTSLRTVTLQDDDAASSKTVVAPSMLILVLCGTHLYMFRGSDTLEDLFASYDPANLNANTVKVFDLPIEQGAAQLQLLYPPSTLEPSHLSGAVAFKMPKPTDFAVLSTSGIYYGKLNLDATLDDELDHLEAHKLLPSSVLLQKHHKQKDHSSSGGGSDAISLMDRPLSMVFTLHHLVLLYPSRLQFVNRISKKTVQEIPLEQFASPLRGGVALPLGLSRDGLAGRVIVLAGDDALEIDTSNEERDIWQILMERGDYRSSLAFCRTSDQRNRVFLAEADSLLKEGRPIEAGAVYGRITSNNPPFEKVVLQLMTAEEPEALVAFLKARLDTFGEEDRPQSTMVATWLLELLLDRANRAALQRSEERALSKVEGARGKYVESNEAVKLFLNEYVSILDPRTTKSLLESYGREDDLLIFAKARGDLEQALEYHVRRGEAERALEILRLPDATNALAYRFAPALVSLAPAQTVQSWIDAVPSLDPIQLLPALLPLAEAGAAPSAREEALRFIRYCINERGTSDPALHNFAINLLASTSEDETSLLEYIAMARDPLGNPLYDPNHGLKLCQENGRDSSSVELLCEMGLWEEALKMAITIDNEIAIDVVQRVQQRGDEELARRLWLFLAEKTVKTLSDDVEKRQVEIENISRLIQKSEGLVRIEDLLPFFPDFVEIGALKPIICSSLEKRNKELSEIKKEMKLTLNTMEELREGMGWIEGRGAAVDITIAECAHCQRPLAHEPASSAGPSGGCLPRFFVFPTGNCFHGSCLCAEVAYLAPDAQQKRIVALQARLAALPEGSVEAPSVNEQQMTSVKSLIQQFESEIAFEDPYCGEIVARNIRKPLISADDDVDSWAI